MNVLRPTHKTRHQTSQTQRSRKNNLPAVFGGAEKKNRPLPFGEHFARGLQLPQLRMDGKRKIVCSQEHAKKIRKAQSGYAQEHRTERQGEKVFFLSRNKRNNPEEIFYSRQGRVDATDPAEGTLHRLPLHPKQRNHQREISRWEEKF